MTASFEDCAEAGRLLVEELILRGTPKNPMVLAVAGRGVAVGIPVARALRAPIDVVIAHTLCTPSRPEVPMGSMASGSYDLDERLLQGQWITQEAIAEAVSKGRREMARREKLLRDGRPAPDLRNRSAVIVDDGAVTGRTVLAAIRHARSLHPARLIVALPVMSEDAYRRLEPEVDELICLVKLAYLPSIASCYAVFSQLSDSESRRLLREETEYRRRYEPD